MVNSMTEMDTPKRGVVRRIGSVVAAIVLVLIILILLGAMWLPAYIGASRGLFN
jgi:hypothetical protein